MFGKSQHVCAAESLSSHYLLIRPSAVLHCVNKGLDKTCGNCHSRSFGMGG